VNKGKFAVAGGSVDEEDEEEDEQLVLGR